MLNIRVYPFQILFIVLLLSSCGAKDSQVKSKVAETVEVVSTGNTSSFNRIKIGSYIEWRASHLGGINPRQGKIYLKKANVLTNNGEITNVNISIDMDKLEVEDLPKDDIQELSEHLKSEDFFDVKKYPTSRFELTKLETNQGEFNSKVTGNLTILDVSKSITFKANITVNKSVISFISEDFSIKRSEWGMTYNAKGTVGVPLDYLISDNIGFTIYVYISK